MTVIRSPSDNLNIVTEYLERNPDFFLDNPLLLSKLNIPHLQGKNVSSLIEYQVSKLRQDTKALKSELETSERDQTRQRHLAETIHETSLELLNCNSIEQLYDCLSAYLRREYQTSEVLIFMFVEQRPCADYKGLRFKKTNSKLQFLFTGLFTRNKPLCDSLESEYLEGLFNQRASIISSTVAVPMQYGDGLALMVLGSKESNVYRQGYSIELLCYLKEIFIYQIKNIIKSGLVKV